MEQRDKQVTGLVTWEPGYYTEKDIILAVEMTCMVHKIDTDLAGVIAGGVVARLRELKPRG